MAKKIIPAGWGCGIARINWGLFTCGGKDELFSAQDRETKPWVILPKIETTPRD